jgi:hypothetical protein
MSKEEFFLQVFERRIIEVELSFERAIGDALPAPEPGNDLVEQDIKVHLPLSLPRACGCSPLQGAS